MLVYLTVLVLSVVVKQNSALIQFQCIPVLYIHNTLYNANWRNTVVRSIHLFSLQYGDEYMPEIESLWCALCTWPTNIRVALNYLAQLTCVAGNLSLMLQQARPEELFISVLNFMSNIWF